MKKKLLSLISLVVLLAGHSLAQPPKLFTPGGIVGSTTSGNNNVGIGTNSPMFDFDVSGDARLSGTGANDGVFFASPGGEKGLSMMRNGFGSRADIRFDGGNLRLMVKSGFGPPPFFHGITINNWGRVAIGNPNPTSILEIADWHILGAPVPQHTVRIEPNASSETFFHVYDYGATIGILPVSYIWDEHSAIWANRQLSGDGIGASLEGGSIGVHASGSGENSSIGVKAEAHADANWDVGTGNHTGVWGIGSNAGSYYGLEHYGVRGTAIGGMMNFGIYGEASSTVIGSTSYAGYFKGRTEIEAGNFIVQTLAGTGTAPAEIGANGQLLRGPSDARLKKNVEDYRDGLEKVMRLRPVRYNFNNTLLYGEGKYLGFIAQEVEKVVPEVVTRAYDSLKTMSVNYAAMVPVLVTAIQEQQKQIQELKKQLETIDAYTRPKADPSLSGAVLYQNEPNPFSHSSVISYDLPSGATEARIFIFDMSGKEVKSLPLRLESHGSISIQAGELKPGIYLYSLIVNGKEADTRRMIITN